MCAKLESLCRCPACNPMHSGLTGIDASDAGDVAAPSRKRRSNGHGMGAMKRDQAARASGVYANGLVPLKKTGRGHGNAAPGACVLCSGTRQTTLERASRFLTYLRETAL